MIQDPLDAYFKILKFLGKVLLIAFVILIISLVVYFNFFKDL